jgi:hypothetical protein
MLEVCVIFVLLAALILVALFFVFLFLRTQAGQTDRPRPRPGARHPQGPRRIRIVNDGFWLDDPALPRGSRIPYRYRAGGRLHQGTIEYYPGPDGHFVYTGETPSDVEIADRTAAVAPPDYVPDNTGLGTAFDRDDDDADLPLPQVQPLGDDTSSSDVGGSFAEPDTSSSSDTGGSFGEPPAY